MRWIIAVLAALVLMLQYRIWFSPHGVREVLQLREQVDTETRGNQLLVDRNSQLAAEVRDLKQDFHALEERARSELGLINAAETYYQVVPASSQEAAEPAATALRTAAN